MEDKIMQLAIMGLGKMGKGLALNMHEHGLDVVATNRSQEPLKELADAGLKTAPTAFEALKLLDSSKPRIFWFMLTAGSVLDQVLFDSGFINEFKPGDIIIDGGNSNFNDTLRRAGLCQAKEVHFLDAGVSGGPAGARNGAAVMVGGGQDAYNYCEPIFKAISVAGGYGYMGPSGSGHYVKMVHNAIEYGMLQAIGEGYELLENGPYKDLDMNAITAVWQHGTVIRGFLIDLMKSAFEKEARLQSIRGYIDDNGEGKWAIETALDHNIPFVVNAYALMFRYITRQDESFAAKVVAALRHEFGGHEVKENLPDSPK